MCGIAGGIFFNNDKISSSKFRTALDQMSTRGPDAAGVFENDHVLLGHRRLSIIDTSESANQPFFDGEKKYVIVFNGEIFNFEQLKNSKLSHLNIRFKTHSDTEVLMQLLIVYGTECLQWLSGFFAFAFYNIHANELIIARDRYGKKPLVIYENEGQFLFASELKALMPLIPAKQLNPISVSLYFQFNYLPPEQSILKSVRKLKPGNYIRIQNNVVTEQKYYALQIRKNDYEKYSYNDACNELVKRMNESVQERMISDVPLGAFLSGGIDSSVIVALAAQHTRQLKTFSIGFKDNPVFDETFYANLVAKKYETDHQVFFLTEQDYKQEVFEVLDYLDEPFADNSCIPQYILCKKTKKHVTVALSGDGGDEVFAGYNKHKAEYMIRNRKWLAQAATMAAPVLKMFPENENTKIGNYFRQFNKLVDGAALSASERHIRWSSLLNTKDVQSLFSKDYQSKINLLQIASLNLQYAKDIKSSDFNEILLTDMNLVLPGDMLHKVDMMSMANSIEVRSPFLDHKVVDFAFSLPAAFKIDKHLKKKIVQDAFRNFLPPELYNRPKQGFDIPLLDWFRNDFNDYIFNILLEKKFVEEQNIFSYEAILRLKNKLHSNSPGFVHGTIWALIAFQYWYKKYMIR